MRKSSFLASALAVTSSLAIACPAVAQYSAQPQTQPYQPQMAPTPTPDADALANAMRQLASNPRDLTALITAGELSLKVGDASGAAALFKRAEQVDPMNGRVKAGMARILVTQERPGEALRYFDQAVGYGLDPRTFAGDRGLAYDLIGQQERAQRDYRLALKAGDNDEVRRRYALSLAISGSQLGAFEQLEPLTRRNDRPAWRARAFVLAMTGDVPGANRIAQGMMPPGMAAGLAPFFTRLPTLSPIDKAFAVHFGEVTPTPQRLADARLTPVLAALGPDPDARPPIVVPSPPPQAPRGKRGRGRATPARVEVASAAPRPTAPTPAAPTPGFGSAGQSPTDPIRTAAAPTTPAPVTPTPTPAPTQLARTDVDPIQKATLADYERVQRFNEERVRRRELAAQRALAPTGSAQIGSNGVAPAPVATPTPVRPTPAPVTVAATPPVPTPAIPTTPPPSSQTRIAAVAPAPDAPVTQSAPTVPSRVAQIGATPAPAATPPAPTAQLATATSSTPTPLAANEDSILARIVKGLSVPGAELGVAPPPTPAPVATPPAEVASAAPKPAEPKPEPVAVAAKTPVPALTRTTTRRPTTSEIKPVATEIADVTPTARRGTRTRIRAAETDEALAPTTRSGRRGTRTQTAVTDETDAPATARTRSGKRADTRTAAKDDVDESAPTSRGKRGARTVAAKDEDATPTTGKRGATTRTSAADKTKKTEKPAAEPSRIWVQVAGGANEKDLGKAYNSVQSRTPALKGKPAYSTPLRATNRVVTGPFKSDAEARAFVNQLAKQGVSAFPFTSDKGQKMTKIPPK